MKLLFIQPKAGFLLRGTTHPMCRTVLFAATYMNRKGFEVKVLNRCTENTNVKKLAEDFMPDMAIVYLSLSSSVQDAVNVSRELKLRGVTVAWAELIAELSPELCYETGCVDYIPYNESILSLHELCEALENGDDISAVKGLYYKKAEKYIKTPFQPAINAAELPSTDWTLTHPEKCFRRFAGRDKMLYLCASIGCPYSCGFCGFSMYDCHKRSKRNIKTVLEEIKYLTDDHGLNAVNFSDELLLFTSEELQEIKAFRERTENGFIWGGETRPTLQSKEQLRQMYDAGCRWLLLGLETGSDHIRKLVGKELDNEKVRQVTEWCTEIGIETYGSFIIGFPGETEDDLRDTVSFALSLDLDAFLFNYFIPVISTALYNKMEQEGIYGITDIQTYEKMISPDRYDRNFSAVPKKDLAVIKAYFDFLTITRSKKTASGKKAGGEFFKKSRKYRHGLSSRRPVGGGKQYHVGCAARRGSSRISAVFRKNGQKIRSLQYQQKKIRGADSVRCLSFLIKSVFFMNFPVEFFIDEKAEEIACDLIQSRRAGRSHSSYTQDNGHY